jgi:hypothetical protein
LNNEYPENRESPESTMKRIKSKPKKSKVQSLESNPAGGENKEIELHTFMNKNNTRDFL